MQYEVFAYDNHCIPNNYHDKHNLIVSILYYSDACNNEVLTVQHNAVAITNA